MSLVAYENSDSSEDESNSHVSSVTLNQKTEEPPICEKELLVPTSVDKINSECGPSLFNLLPQPKNKKLAVEEDDEFLHKKDDIILVKPKAKITVPSLSDFKDVENTITMSKPKASNGKKSGLLSILPQPKNAVITTTKTLIPHVLTQKPNNATKKHLPSPLKKAEVDSKLSNDYSDDSDNDEEVQNDFFSINKPLDIPTEDIPLKNDQKQSTVIQVNVPSNQKVTLNIETYFKQDVAENDVDLQSEHTESSIATNYAINGFEASGSPNNEVVLDEEAILKLCGSRGKRKREDIQIVDVNQQEVLAEAREWLLKGLMDDTSKRVSASKKKGNEPTSQQKRKHQITYLAHQAKANEAELQNQWANNRMSKRQTQSKYGF